MKTLIEVGDKVFDSALFGDLEGKVVRIDKEYLTAYPIYVKYGEKNTCYTVDGRQHKDYMLTLSMQPYDKLSDIVPVWEEEEVWGLCWDFNSSPRYYGRIIKSTNAKYPYRIDGAGDFKNFKETGKLI
jgi:hypothetical protein